MKITKNTTIAEILKKPGAEEILIKYNLPCLSCSMAKFELKHLKIGDVAKVYKLDLEGILQEFNKARSKSPKNFK